MKISAGYIYGNHDLEVQISWTYSKLARVLLHAFVIPS